MKNNIGEIIARISVVVVFTVTTLLIFYYAPFNNDSKNTIEHGKFLFESTGCISCHGIDGVGGIENPNYALKTVPELNTMANKLRIPDKSMADIIINMLEKNVDLKKISQNPPFPTYDRFFSQYNAINKKIIDGANYIQKADSSKPAPPLYMPAWKNFLSHEDINSIMCYLISLNNWEE